ncbi:MAG: polyhydroxyalkanoate synthesis regulator DNA-binding domain-containing protein, partial [Leptospira sp.]|nr:polyhydroxyalkanoate synthesis regulator DNA-binding domain-containing protein [Leptospira sp.]
MKLLKRYANRRLYDPETSSTITLEDVAKMIINGEEIKVQDNMSGEDITPKILGQTFLKVSLGQRNEDFSNFMLTSLIREAGRDVSGLFERLVLGGIGANYL